jgi:diacylglycerol O-acyltransferase
MAERQRLGAQDVLWLAMDRPGNLMIVDSLFWTATPLDWDRYMKVVQERLWDRYLVFRSVVVQLEDHHWYWEEQPEARLEDRFEQVTLAAPGGDEELQELIAAQRVVPLDRSEPLWHAICVDGYRGGSAVLFRTHHAIADGIRMVQLALGVFDSKPDEEPSVTGAPEPATPQTLPEPVGRARSFDLLDSSVKLARSAVVNPVGAVHTTAVLTRATARSGAALTGAAGRAALAGTLGRVRVTGLLATVPGDIDTIRKLTLGTRNDTAVWTGPVSDRKAIAWSPPLPLEEVKEVADANAATVNDVLVSCVAESLRSYLERRRAVCGSVTWDVPVNLKPFDPDLPLTLGNAFALVQLELPTGIGDPLRTLRTVRRRMRRIKAGHEAVVDFGVQAAVARLGGRAYRAAVDLIADRAIGVLTNVPGPQQTLYAAGQRVDGMLGWAPVTSNQVMSFTIYSYDGKVFVGIAADRERVPDHRTIVEGFGQAFRRLRAATEGLDRPVEKDST